MLYFYKSDSFGVPLVLFVVIDGERDGLWRPSLFGALVFLCRMLQIFALYEMFNVWDTVSTTVPLPGMFLLTNFLFKKRIGLVSIDLLYIIFSYYTKDNQQECFRLAVFRAVDEPVGV